MFRINGKVKKIYFSSQDNFFICDIEDVEVLVGEEFDLKIRKNGTLNVKGYLVSCVEKQNIDIFVEEENTTKFGTTYIIVDSPEAGEFQLEDSGDLLAFFSTLTLTENQLNALLDIENIITHIKTENIEAITKARGIGEKTAQKIINKYNVIKEYQIYYELLFNAGIEKLSSRIKIVKHFINKIENKYRYTNSLEADDVVPFYYIKNKMNEKIEEMKKNPYLLLEVDGFGLLTVDEIAINFFKIEFNSKYRIESFAKFVLEREANLGNSFMSSSDFANILAKEINTVKKENITEIKNIQFGEIKNVILDMEKRDVILFLNDRKIICLKYYYELEEEVAEEIYRINNSKIPIEIKDMELTVRDTELYQGFHFTMEQRQAISSIVNSKGVSLLTGSAGTGKTSVLNAINHIFYSYRVGLFSFAGRAAQRMAETTGMPASTMHKHIFKHQNAEDKTDTTYDVYIIDECSMIHLSLFLEFIQTIPSGAKLIILGDYNQLPAIGVGNVFKDILSSNVITVARLTKVMRQALDSGILSTAIKVKDQVQLYPYESDKEEMLGFNGDLKVFLRKDSENLSYVVIEKFKEYLEINDYNLLRVQMISPIKDNSELSCYNLNLMAQNLLKDYLSTEFLKVGKFEFRIGDKVVNCKNNYKAKTEDKSVTAVFNGNIGIIKGFERDNSGKIDGLIVDFTEIGVLIFDKEDCNSLELAYALTIHKCQGSEFPYLIFALPYALTMLSCNLVYTGLTRAKVEGTLVAHSKALYQAVRTCDSNRNTFLSSLLVEKFT